MSPFRFSEFLLGYIMSAGMDTSLSVNTGNDPALGP